MLGERHPFGLPAAAVTLVAEPLIALSAVGAVSSLPVFVRICWSVEMPEEQADKPFHGFSPLLIGTMFGHGRFVLP